MKQIEKTFEECYMYQVTYIKKFYGTTMTNEQKKNLERFEAISKDVNKQIKDMGLTQEQGFRIFRSVITKLKQFKRQIQNQWKFTKTDYEAWKIKTEKTGVPFIDILQIVNIERKVEPANVEALHDLNFPILSYDNKQLCRLASHMLKTTGFAMEENLNGEKINNLVVKIVKNYNVVSYHNFSHAFSLFLMLTQCYQMSPEFKAFISNFEIFCAMIAAIAHDLNHKGSNNLYEIKKGTDRAEKYNNQSVLENMHISTLFKIFKNNPDVDIINCLKDPLLKERAKRLIIRCVLATDMSKHFASIEVLKEKRKATEEMKIKPDDLNEYLAFQKNRMEDREIILDYVVHSCDIGNPCLEFNNYMNWAGLLAHEFNEQTKKEERNGLEVTGFLKYVDKPTFYKGQLGFSKNMVLPLWKELSLLWPSLKKFNDQVEDNLVALEKIIQTFN